MTLGVDIPVLMLGKTEAAPGFTTKTLPAAKAAISSGRGSILHKPSMESEATRQLCWGSKLSGLTVAHPQRPLGDCRAIVHSLLPPPQLLEARQPGRGTCPRSACQVCTHYGTSPTLPMWQPLAPQRAGPSVRITSVPMSGRARGAWPLSHPPSLLSAPNLVLGEHALPAEIQAAQRLWEQYDLWDS